MNTFCLYSQGCCGSIQMVTRLKEIGLKRVAPVGNGTGKREYNAHTKYPVEEYTKKVLFMYGDPRDILLSALSRSDNNSFFWEHSFWLDGDHKNIDPYGKITIKQILEQGKDPFQLEDHFLNWLNVKNKYPLMMLKYEALEYRATFKQVLDFFEVEGNYEYNWKLRKSSYKNLPEDQQIGITDMFQNLLDIQKELPPCFIMERKDDV